MREKKILIRLYVVVALLVVFSIAIGASLVQTQVSDGAKYTKLALERTEKIVTIEPNRGSLYSDDGSLLATSVSRYEIRFDAVTVPSKDFELHLIALSDSLGVLLQKPANYFEQKLRKAKANKNRYALIASNLSYESYKRIKSFPLFSKGPYRGGFVVTQKTVREHPLGEMAARSVGFVSSDAKGNITRVGLEGAFDDYLKGVEGKRLKQKIAKGQWKPIGASNLKEPEEGADVVTTININIQDIAHHALLTQLEKYKADHGTVVVMETKTGYVKAISNLGKIAEETYAETTNYAIAESHEPGSTYKLADLMTLLEDKKVDTSAVYNTNGGVIMYFGKKVVDSHEGGYGSISLAQGFEKSSNTVMVQAVYNNYKNDPSKFVNHLNAYGLNSRLGLPFQGEGKPYIPQPTDKTWSNLSLPWMAFGYGVSITPLQTLTYYNAVANNGEMVKPQFVSEIKEWNNTIKKFDKQVINPKICSQETILKLKAVLENVVKRGTASKLYSKDFSMAGKTGTAQANYGTNGGADKHYISSFVGYFPADLPKYSCIVVVHNPDSSNNNYYGADVAGPVFKRIAQKIFTDSPTKNIVKNLDLKNSNQEKNYSDYYTKSQENKNVIPNLKGMSGMDAVAILGNLKVKVKVIGVGKVKRQSLNPGQAIKSDTIITLELS